MNKQLIGNIIIFITMFSIICIIIYMNCNIKYLDEVTLGKVVDKITINGVLIKKLQYKEAFFVGGSNPYPWDLWKSSGLIRYYFVEDLVSERADNYRDVIVGISLLYPVPEKDRDYPTGTYRGTSELNACVFTFCEGADAKLIYCGETLVSNYEGVPDRWEGDRHYNAGETSDLYPGYKYDLKYIPLSVLSVSSP
jgi:hypothetical protein